MKRREFLQHSTALAAGCLIPVSSFSEPAGTVQKIGVQLFSVPKLLEKDFRSGIKMLASIGFQELELYGPFPFSTDAAKAGWSKVTPSLGFSGSGYFGHSPDEVRSILNQNGLSAPSIHTDLDTMQTRMSQLGEAGQQIGFQYIGLPSIPEVRRKTLDGYKKMADEFNKLGEQAKKVGLKFTYHNHGYGMQQMEGQVPLDLILNRTDPALVFFEMDIYWTVAGGADPVAYLEKYPNRYHLMHIKDMKEKVKFSGDGGNSAQWIELFPYMTTAGDGVMDLKSIITKGKTAGVKHFFVEQDMVVDPEIALKRSFDYVKSI